MVLFLRLSTVKARRPTKNSFLGAAPPAWSWRFPATWNEKTLPGEVYHGAASFQSQLFCQARANDGRIPIYVRQAFEAMGLVQPQDDTMEFRVRRL